MLVMMTMMVAMMVMMVTMMVVVVGRTVMVVVTFFNSSPHCHTSCHSQSCSPYTRSTLQRDVNDHKKSSE